MVSEVVSLVCSDSCENGITKKNACEMQCSGNPLFQSIAGSKAMYWNFHSVKRLDELVEQEDGRKSQGREAEFSERI